MSAESAIVTYLLTDRMLWLLTVAVGAIGWAAVFGLMGLLLFAWVHAGATAEAAETTDSAVSRGHGPEIIFSARVPVADIRPRMPVAPRRLVAHDDVTGEYTSEHARTRPVWDPERTTTRVPQRYTRHGVIDGEGELVPTTGGMTWRPARETWGEHKIVFPPLIGATKPSED